MAAVARLCRERKGYVTETAVCYRYIRAYNQSLSFVIHSTNGQISMFRAFKPPACVRRHSLRSALQFAMWEHFREGYLNRVVTNFRGGNVGDHEKILDFVDELDGDGAD